MTDIFLSIIVPAYNEADRLPSSLEKIERFLGAQPYRAEVIVVENGSTDRTAEVVRELAAQWPNLCLIQQSTRGKGLAVRRGMLEAQGEYRFICDADLSMPIEEVAKFLPPRLNSYDVAIGSREAPGAVRYNEPLYTHLRGRIFSNLVKLLALRGFEDTQCGFKCLRGEVARDLFSVQRLGGWSFDVEMLFVAQQRGYKIVEVPIDWYYMPGSKVNGVRDSLRMLADIMTIRRNWSRGAYERARQV